MRRPLSVFAVVLVVVAIAGWCVPNALAVNPRVHKKVVATSSATVKPVLQGLLDRKGMPSASYLPRLDGYVVLTNWASLQPTAGGPIAANNPIDKAIAAIRASSATAHLRLKIRALTGVEAPSWAKSLGGAPVPVYDGARISTMGRFWTSAFGAAYADFQRKLAAKYDAVPEIAEVVISRCMITYAEPFLRAGRADDRTRKAMLAAGFSVAADTTCHREEIAAHAAWTTTRSGLDADPYDRIAADASYLPDLSFTTGMMAYCRQTLGNRCVLENNAISSPLMAAPYPTLYSAIAASGGPIGFQTRNAERIGDWRATLLWAAEQGANYVELNITYPMYDPVELAAARARLRATPTS